MMTMRLCIVVVALMTTLCCFLQTTASQEVHVVGDDFGWTIPPAGAAFYQAWAFSQTFHVGDILLFNFTNGDQDVAQVTKEAFLKCNTTNPIAVKKTNPSNFTLDSEGDLYFTSTFTNHCASGQMLALHVFAPGPSPSSSPKPKPKPRGPLNYTVGGVLGWVVPPGGEIVYAAWASVRTFKVGDALVFYFVNGTEDVAVVTKEGYEKCETNSSIGVYSSSPTRIVLNSMGEHYYTSTYKDHCGLGQKLAINVTSNSSSSSSSSGGSALSPQGALSPTAIAPVSSASGLLSGYVASFFFVAVTFFY